MTNTSEFTERHLTGKERDAATWLLNHGNTDASPYLLQLDHATVSGGCGCGCASIDFAINGIKPNPAGMQILSDHYWVDPHGHTGGIFVFASSNQLAGLEVYSMDGECDVTQLPDLSRLVPVDFAEHSG